jgi:Asp-tRNA(Asn)/Glu-tRNA(Gln) amidotransferase A subunit family amidase
MSYDLKPVRAPKLGGPGLRIFAALIESALFRPFLLPGLFKKTGVAAFRKQSSKAAPTSYPLVKPAEPLTQCPRLELVEIVAGAEPKIEPQGFRFPSITDFARAYRDGSVSPEEIGNRVVASIESSNRGELPLRAIIKSKLEDIQKQAAESSMRIKRGEPRSILEGVPVVIKDELDMLRYTTQVGTAFLGREVAREDATVVGRLRSAGALLVGKSNMFEIGISPTGNNPIHGFARNPYDLNHDAGGSSGGSGASVGSGIVPLAIGADGGGSIRIPAAHCGIVGLKPTFGRVSEFGAAPLCWSVAHVGPMGATALDAAIGYAVCAGRDPKDPMSLQQPSVQLQDFHNQDLRGITLGVCRAWFDDASPEIVERCKEALEILKEAGAVVKEISIAGLEAIRVAHVITILSEMATAMEPYYATCRKEFSHPTRINLALARQFTGRDYVHAQQVRTEAMREWARVLSKVDAVITPTTACAPPYLEPGTVRYGEADMGTQTELMRYVVSANFCGMPAISFPAGYSREGLPIGIQAIAGHWKEELLLRMANVAEQSIERRKPAAYHGTL